MLRLIPLLPFVGFLINLSLGRRLSKRLSGAVACLAMFGAFLASAWSVWTLVQMAPDSRGIVDRVAPWIESGALSIPFTLRLDPLGAVMVLVVTGIGFLIHLYSTAYMHEERASEYARYFSYLNLFAAFMLVLVLGASFPVMFVGWEGVGLCSYLLIGFWFSKKSASDAGKKAFIVNRVGDFGFLLGMFMIWVQFGTLDFQAVAHQAGQLPPETVFGTLSIATLLLFVGAAGKSAQIPLYVWLPDAMEGPTPVSALIHAATMVTAGVYMIGRNAVLFSHAPDTMAVVAGIGVATALMAGTIGLVQNDIKRVLAYSTVSQLGFMFVAMGVGAFAAGIFHLFTHAFFKALLFLGSGAVIHALAGEQDIRKMGGLRRELPVTYWTFLIGSVAIAGVPFFSGFFSKDEILWKAFSGGHYAVWTVAVLTSLLTATYMFRLVFLTFHGSRAVTDSGHGSANHDPAVAGAHGHGASGGGPHDAGNHSHNQGGGRHLHDAPPAMAIALILLAVGSVVAGYIGFPKVLGGSNRIEQFLEPSFAVPGIEAGGGLAEATGTASAIPPAEGHAEAPPTAGGAGHAEALRPFDGLRVVPSNVEGRQAQGEGGKADGPGATAEEHRAELSLMAFSSGIAIAGIGLAGFFFLRRRDVTDRIAANFAGIHRLLLNKYYVDEAYDAVIVQPIFRVSERGLWKIVDAGLIDGAVNTAGASVSGWSEVLRRLQTGSIRAYALSIVVGVVVILGYYVWR
ncbi:MAG: NADH-quinone oxidoreductase subunit L [Acidobacteria bacterium]|nr:NADH-quinone oxidoreductase subunit L [Acidobacteriota bacterium]